MRTCCWPTGRAEIVESWDTVVPWTDVMYSASVRSFKNTVKIVIAETALKKKMAWKKTGGMPD